MNAALSKTVRPNIELHIDRLVLDGVSIQNLKLLGAVLEQELASHFENGGIPSSLMQDNHTSKLDGGRMNLRTGATSTSLGKDLANSIYAGFRNKQL
jgi:hypothetical protein